MAVAWWLLTLRWGMMATLKGAVRQAPPKASAEQIWFRLSRVEH
jgi:hypothetical protein